MRESGPTSVRPAAEVQAARDDASTRRRVLQSIMQHGPSTATELAERLALTPAAIRRHLAVLVERGELSSREQRVYGHRGRGRPAKDFVLTDAGRESFPQAYDDLAIAALSELSEAFGDGALDRLARTRIARVEVRYREIQANEPDRSPVVILAEALTDDGYVASTQPALAGEQLCQHHCPVAHVAQHFPQLCEAETKAFSRLLGVHVQRLATIAHGDGVCTTHVPRVTSDLQMSSDPDADEFPAAAVPSDIRRKA